MLTPEQIEALSQTEHGLTFLRRLYEALDDYLREEENRMVIDGLMMLGAGGISMDEAARNLSRFAIPPIVDLQYNDEIVDNKIV